MRQASKTHETSARPHRALRRQGVAAAARVGHSEIAAILQDLGLEFVDEVTRSPRHGVYRALRGDEIVAVKVASARMDIDIEQPPASATLRGALSELHHPHLVPIIDAGEIAGRTYWIMPFLDGSTLASHLERCGPMSEGHVIALGKALAAGLVALHRQGLAHRRVQLDSILIDTHGLVTLISMDKSVLSCEREAGRDDVHALGVVLLACLIGQRPSPMGSPLAKYRPDLSPGLLALMARLRKPADSPRYPSAAALCRALQDIAAGIPTPRLRRAAGVADIIGHAAHQLNTLAHGLLPEATLHDDPVNDATSNDVWKRVGTQAPGVLYELTRNAQGALSFGFLGPNSESLWGISDADLAAQGTLLLSCMDRNTGDDFMATMNESARLGARWLWEGACTVRGRRKWIQNIARPQCTPRSDGCTQWTGIFIDMSQRKVTENAMESALADLAEVSARERLRAEALMATCNRLQGPATPTVTAESAKQASLSSLASGLAHELNNPLAGITFMFDAMQGDSLSPARRDEYAASVRAGLLRMQTTVSGLLQYAQPQPLQLRDVTWAEVAQNVLLTAQPALEEKSRRLRHRLDTPARVRAHASQLGRALFNVLLNAIHASPRGALIELRSEVRDNRVGLHVIDHGPGIPQEYLARVCDPFFTTKGQGQGTGLGLTTAARILQNHDGELCIASVEGEGTQATFWLPMVSTS